MIQPTQAQIEAAAEAINHALFDCGAKRLSLGEYDEHAIAKAALTAAAQAGEPEIKYVWARPSDKEKEWRAATIERCARMAEDFKFKIDYQRNPEQIAAAIRKLKDAP